MKNKKIEVTNAIKKQNDSILEKLVKLNEYNLDSNVNLNYKSDISKMEKIGYICWYEDGQRCFATIQEDPSLKRRSISLLDKNLSKEEIVQEAIKLSKEGYKQVEIANMLGRSQSSISGYLRKNKSSKK